MATNNKVALVTGGSSGIGLACVQRLRKDGFDVFTIQRKCAEGFYNLPADLANPKAPRQIIEQVIRYAGRLDVLINNAGMMLEGTVQEMSPIDWNRTLSVNLTAPFLLMKHSIPHLSGHGSIVNVGSIEGLGSNLRHPAYCASKAGLHALTRAVAVDHGPDGIRSNAIAPG
jgi:meso-butanediol dehydrogenase/(S,S)-butanediol dehydrogenase/diacetyl reductase